MTTLVAKLSPALSRGVARAADRLKMTHEQVACVALRLFVKSSDENGRTDGRTEQKSRRIPSREAVTA